MFANELVNMPLRTGILVESSYGYVPDLDMSDDSNASSLYTTLFKINSVAKLTFQ